jgi:hypothetical protein
VHVRERITAAIVTKDSHPILIALDKRVWKVDEDLWNRCSFMNDQNTLFLFDFDNWKAPCPLAQIQKSLFDDCCSLFQGFLEPIELAGRFVILPVFPLAMFAAIELGIAPFAFVRRWLATERTDFRSHDDEFGDERQLNQRRGPAGIK